MSEKGKGKRIALVSLLLFVFMLPCYGTPVDSVWFSEEIVCNDSNIVQICYRLSGVDSATVSVAISADSGSTWVSAGTGWFSALMDTAGDLGAVDSGIHCFNWIMSTDLPDSESFNFAIRVTVPTIAPESGQWRFFQYDVQHTGRSPYSICEPSELRILWTLSLSDIVTFPAVFKDSLIYFATRTGSLYCVNYRGDIKWTIYLGNTSQSGPALLGDGSIVIGNQSNQLVNVAPDGTINWTWSTGLSVNGIRHCPVQTADGKIYCVGYHTTSSYGYLFSIRPDGSLRWSLQIPGSGTWLFCSPALDENELIFLTDYNNSPGQLDCIDSTSSVHWRFTGYPFGGETDLRSSPTVDTIRHRIYFGTNKTDPRGIAAVDYTSSSASLAWFYNAGGGNNVDNSAAMDSAGNIYIGSSNGTLFSLAPDGTLRWSRTFSASITGDPIVDPEGHLLFGTGDGYLFIYSADGDSLTSFYLGGAVASPIIGESGNIYVGTRGSTFVCIGCDAVDTVTTFAPLDSRPLRVNLYCDSLDSAVIPGATISLGWDIADMFWANDPGTLKVTYCDYETTFAVPGTTATFVLPEDAAGCDSVYFIVAAPDSFCNWGYDTCAVPILTCRPAVVWLVCPPDLPLIWSSCANQWVIFGVADTSGFEIDTTRVFVSSIVNGDTIIIPPDSLEFSYSGDTVWISVPGRFADKDSVVVSIDSVFNEAGCKTAPVHE
ncbi:PQQ-binding-like beta-propeller repeat protein [bacterium]|nr:PQQ-binding-like beta-propeller repeat protein [bacterium]